MGLRPPVPGACGVGRRQVRPDPVASGGYGRGEEAGAEGRRRLSRVRGFQAPTPDSAEADIGYPPAGLERETA